jgi:hypothetical protein
MMADYPAESFCVNAFALTTRVRNFGQDDDIAVLTLQRMVSV